jgi:pyrroloquinoline quinone (PQQ) biosynthesis protein C
MNFHDELSARTTRERQRLIAAPIIGRTLAGALTRAEYIAFLTQAFHHVRHTVPLMMAVGSRLPERLNWLRKEVVHYAEEEEGHEQWILNDIAAAGGDPEEAISAAPSSATDAMIGYAYDTVMRRNAVGFFGMVFVLEGTSVSLALNAAEQIQKGLALPAKALTYLRSHGQLDREHIHHLSGILNRLDDGSDRSAVLTCARVMFTLYGNVFRELDDAHCETGEPLRATA